MTLAICIDNPIFRLVAFSILIVQIGCADKFAESNTRYSVERTAIQLSSKFEELAKEYLANGEDVAFLDYFSEAGDFRIRKDCVLEFDGFIFFINPTIDAKIILESTLNTIIFVSSPVGALEEDSSRVMVFSASSGGWRGWGETSFGEFKNWLVSFKSGESVGIEEAVFFEELGSFE